MNIYHDLEKFYLSVDDFTDKSNIIIKKIEKERESLEKIILGSFKKSFSLSRFINIEKNNPLKNKVEELKISFKTSEKVLTEKLSNLLKELKFYEENIDSFIIVVFGKVNSGKSSLGNLIAGKKFNKPNYNKNHIKFFQYDHKNNNKKIEVKYFEEKETECTAHIQEFKIGALKWVDTPGIHSITEKHGNLAKDFVKNADLIIFTTSSDAPLREGDIKELKSLDCEKKPFILVISKVDAYDEDEVNGEMVKILKRKSDIDIKSQIKWCDDEIKKSNLKNSYNKVIPISCKLALDAINNNNLDLLKDSGLNNFLEYTTALIKKDGLNHKIRNPIGRLSSSIDDMIKDISNQSENFSRLKKEIDKYSKELLRDIDGTSSIIINNITSELETIFSKFKNDYRIDNINDISESLNKEINQVIKKTFEKIMTERIKENLDSFSDKINTDFSDFLVSPLDVIKKETISNSNPYTKNISATTAGAIGTWVGGTLGSSLGPAGAIIGSIAGATIFGWIGSSLGGMYKSTEEINIKIGTNLDDEKIKLLDSLKIVVNETVLKVYNDINKSYFSLLKDIINDINEELKTLEINLENKKKEVNKIGI